MRKLSTRRSDDPRAAPHALPRRCGGDPAPPRGRRPAHRDRTPRPRAERPPDGAVRGSARRQDEGRGTSTSTSAGARYRYRPSRPLPASGCPRPHRKAAPLGDHGGGAAPCTWPSTPSSVLHIILADEGRGAGGQGQGQRRPWNWKGAEARHAQLVTLTGSPDAIESGDLGRCRRAYMHNHVH